MLLISKLLAYFFNETFNLRLEFAGFLMPFCDENIISHCCPCTPLAIRSLLFFPNPNNQVLASFQLNRGANPIQLIEKASKHLNG